MASEQQVFEFRGVDNLYVAEVIEDDETAYTCSTPIHLAPVAEVGKSTDSSSEAHYYDNKAMIVINSESADTISITMAPPELAKLAEIIGKSFDASTGMMVDSPRQNKYFAIMYRTKGTDGKYRYVSRLKGQFTIPEETSATEDDGTDTNNTSIEFTGIYTEHEFTKGIFNGTTWEPAGVKGIVVDTRYGLADVTNFFDQVQTPDTIESGAVATLTISPTTSSLAVGGQATISVTANTTGESVTWSCDDTDTVAISTSGQANCGIVGIGIGTANITATAGNLTATCEVEVGAS